MSDSGNQISILGAKNLKLTAFMFTMMEHFSRDYNISNVNSTSVLKYQHQWELKQKKLDNIEAPKVDKKNWAKTMENIMLHLKLMSRVKGAPLADVVWCYVKIAHIPPGHDAYLNLDRR